MMAKTHRLRDLQVREAGQDHLDILFSNVHQSFLQVGQQPSNQIDFAAQP